MTDKDVMKYWRNRVTDALAPSEYQPGINWFEITKARYDELKAERNLDMVKPIEPLTYVKNEARYMLSVDYRADKAQVRSVTIRNYGMSSQELGDFVRDVDGQYVPDTMVIIREAKKEST